MKHWKDTESIARDFLRFAKLHNSDRQIKRFIYADPLDYLHSVGKNIREIYGLWGVNSHLGDAEEVSLEIIKIMQRMLKDYE